MYIDKSIGELIRSLRKDTGFTQDALSMDLCSTQSVSRIENASQNPSGTLIRRLLERLGEPGFFRGYYHEKEYIRDLDIKISVIESFELRDLTKFERWMNAYEEAYNPQNVPEAQFYQFIKLLYYELLCGGDKCSPGDYIELIRMSHPRFCIEKVNDYLYEHTEFLLLNCLASSYTYHEDFEKSELILKKLLESVSGSRHFLPSYWKTKAGLYNNLAICQYQKGNKKGAHISIEKAFSYIHFDVGILFVINLLKSRIYIENNHLKNHYYYLLQFCYHHLLGPEIKKNLKLDMFLKESCFISII